jgi:hypothetical protein
MDLRRAYPRSAHERLGGYMHLARMIDKARALRAGTIGDYIYPCPLDQRLLQFLGISADRFLEAVTDRDDAGMVEWVHASAKSRTADELAAFDRTIEPSADRLDREEGRAVPRRAAAAR